MAYTDNGLTIFEHPHEVPDDKTGLRYHQYGAADPEHPARNSSTAFVPGEDVLYEGAPAKVVDVAVSDGVPFYRIAFGVVREVSGDALKKVAE